MDSRGASEGIGRGHSCHKSRDLGIDWRAPSGGPTGEFGPVLTETAPLPPQNGVGGNDHERLPLPSPDPGPRHPEEPISRAQLGPGHRLLVHGELLAQREVLKGEVAVAAAEEMRPARVVCLGKPQTPPETRPSGSL